MYNLFSGFQGEKGNYIMKIWATNKGGNDDTMDLNYAAKCSVVLTLYSHLFHLYKVTKWFV